MKPRMYLFLYLLATAELLSRMKIWHLFPGASPLAYVSRGSGFPEPEMEF